MKVVEKKIWPEFFRRVKARTKNVEIRLADFRIAKGDALLLREWDPKKRRYTGRTVRRRVRAVHRVDLFTFHSAALLRRYGVYAIELH